MRAVVLGGGVAGMAAALALAEEGSSEVTLIEREARPGGLAGSFEHAGRWYPLGYHHILHRDATLLWMLDRLGLLSAVRWRRVRMLFRIDGRLYDLARPRDVLRFPLGMADKARLARLVARAVAARDWRRWEDRSAAELVDRWAGPAVREALFEPLCRLKFELPCERVSAAWLGARLAFREGASALGYLPGETWTRALCDGLAGRLAERGVDLRLGVGARRLLPRGGRIAEVELAAGGRLAADLVVCALPSDVYLGLVGGDDASAGLQSIRYTALLSAVVGTDPGGLPDFYWLNLTSLDCTACAIFRLDGLDPTLGPPGEATINFVTHLGDRARDLFGAGEDDLLAAYGDDFARVFGREMAPRWTRISRLPRYSPIFTPEYRNPPVRSGRWENVYFAGNHLGHPTIASTGSAMATGLGAAAAALADRGRSSGLARRAAAFRPRRRPRDRAPRPQTR